MTDWQTIDQLLSCLKKDGDILHRNPVHPVKLIYPTISTIS